MRILIVGNGGREHTLLWKLRRDAPSAAFYATRPNGGMAPLCQSVDLAPTDTVALAGWAAAQRIDLAVIGPEAPLAGGLADRMIKSGVPTFGPSAAAARIESSKAYAKELMTSAGVPTAAYGVFETFEEAEVFIKENGAPIVVKASGLAAGKGAVVCTTEDEALSAAREMLSGSFGTAGATLVIEEFMEGEELSVFALTDGTDILALTPSQDHKRIFEGDEGPNTGGMGAYAPVSIATPSLMDDINNDVLLPTLTKMRDEGSPFRGLLYAGLMITDTGPRVVEFNCRFGDPETQAVLPLMEGNLLDVMMTIAEGGSIAGATLPPCTGAAVTTVLASEGYPGAYPKGKPIHIPPGTDQDDVLVFHAGTALDGDTLITSGGRVLAVTALGETFNDARQKSITAAGQIEFEGRQFRKDIGWRESNRV